jgi:3'-phosphoadenosine 5'-phosphosulfate sulfotransferase (PAPS reductase)/FAD synthetase
VAPIRRFLAEIEGPKVVYDGIRAAESNIRATYTPVWYHPSFRCLSVSPLFYWSDERVHKYLEQNELPRSPAADLGTSAECWCGAYKCPADFRKLLEVHPDIFDKLVEVEEAQDGKYTFMYKNGMKIPLKSLQRPQG